VHEGRISPNDGWEAICQYNAAMLRPAWALDRLKREADRLTVAGLLRLTSFSDFVPMPHRLQSSGRAPEWSAATVEDRRREARVG
jgi:hypothetical protein